VGGRFPCKSAKAGKKGIAREDPLEALEKIRQKKLQDVAAAEKLSGEEKNRTDLLTTKVAVKSVGELIENARNQGA